MKIIKWEKISKRCSGETSYALCSMTAVQLEYVRTQEKNPHWETKASGLEFWTLVFFPCLISAPPTRHFCVDIHFPCLHFKVDNHENSENCRSFGKVQQEARSWVKISSMQETWHRLGGMESLKMYLLNITKLKYIIIILIIIPTNVIAW